MASDAAAKAAALGQLFPIRLAVGPDSKSGDSASTDEAWFHLARGRSAGGRGGASATARADRAAQGRTRGPTASMLLCSGGHMVLLLRSYAVQVSPRGATIAVYCTTVALAELEVRLLACPYDPGQYTPESNNYPVVPHRCSTHIDI
eukprot:1439390-Rhodomonas_salina.1